jgi:hypothetical protein
LHIAYTSRFTEVNYYSIIAALMKIIRIQQSPIRKTKKATA